MPQCQQSAMSQTQTPALESDEETKIVSRHSKVIREHHAGKTLLPAIFSNEVFQLSEGVEISKLKFCQESVCLGHPAS